MAFFDEDTLRRIAQEAQAQMEPVALVSTSAFGLSYISTRFGTGIASTAPARIGTDIDLGAALVVGGISEYLARKAPPEEPSKWARGLRMVAGGAFGSFCSRAGWALGGGG